MTTVSPPSNRCIFFFKSWIDWGSKNAVDSIDLWSIFWTRYVAFSWKTQKMSLFPDTEKTQQYHQVKKGGRIRVDILENGRSGVYTSIRRCVWKIPQIQTIDMD